MGFDRHVYTVELRNSIAGVRVIAWRRKNRIRQAFGPLFPYHLAMYLSLIPTQNGFTNKLYDFSSEDLDKLEASPNNGICRVYRKRASVFVTVDLSKV